MDKVQPATRSKIMAAIRGKDTSPEKAVRHALFRRGFRYRLHAKGLPGVPDIVLPRYRTAIFVHGCFWHGHDCPRGRRPLSNRDFWDRKLNSNRVRDLRNQEALRSAGWQVQVIWECMLDADCRKVLDGLEMQRHLFKGPES